MHVDLKVVEARSFEYCHFADIAIDDEMKL